VTPVGPLYVDYFFLAHDGYTGRPHIDTDLLGAGLAGAVLADLVTAGLVAIGSRHVHVETTDGTAAPSVTARTVLDLLRRSAHPLDEWVDALARPLCTVVGDEIVHSGLASRHAAGRLATLTRQPVRYVPTDAVRAAAPRVLLRHAADATPVDPRTVTLAALAVATGLEGVVADGANRLALGRLRVIAAEASGDVLTIVNGVNSAAIRIALTPRRGQ
jgi:hypothetical protein